MLITLDDLRRFTVARNFPKPTTLKRALHRMGYVQADPIRAPARAQDLILRHRVKDYRAGDLERRYASLGVEEDFFLNYGFVTRPLQALMHPRPDAGVPADSPRAWPVERHDAPAGRDALPRHAARREARGRHPHLRRPPPRDRSVRRRRSPGEDRRARRRGCGPLRAAPLREPRELRQAAAIRRPPVARRAEGRPRTGPGSALSC